MDMNLIQDRTQEIKNELTLLNHALKMSVTKAIRIGELLTEQKEFVGHGKFITWVEGNLDISVSTAEKYIGLSQYRDKIALSTNLQDAYKQIETLEAQERQSKEERERQLISEYRKTGKKPAGWDRSLDYRIKKDEEAFTKQQERIDQAKKEREERAKVYKLHTYPNGQSFMSDALKTATENIIAKNAERQNWKEKIRLSEGGKEDAFMDAIIDYMETLPDDNRRIEACNNIIKICRNIAVELQKSQLSTGK
jgi:hypothetical protein